MGYSDEKDEHAGAGASSSTSTSAAASSSTSSSPDAPPTYLGERQPLNHPSDDAGVGYKETQPCAFLVCLRALSVDPDSLPLFLVAAQTTIVMHNGEPVIHQYPVVAAAPPLYSSHYLPSHQQGFLPYHQSPPHDAQAQESLDSAACTRFHSVAKSLWLNFWWCTLGGGLLCFMFYVALGILLCVTIIFIPLGFRVLKLSVSLLAPFEHTNVRTTDKKSGKVICLTVQFHCLFNNILIFILYFPFPFLFHII